MFPRSIKNELAYYRYKRAKPGICAFCTIEMSSDEIVERGSHMVVLKNKFPYSRWDGRKVVDHLMVIPIGHVTSLNKLSSAAMRELLNIVSEYEDTDYSFYLRAPRNKSRTIPHIHGHLIKLR